PDHSAVACEAGWAAWAVAGADSVWAVSGTGANASSVVVRGRAAANRFMTGNTDTPRCWLTETESGLTGYPLASTPDGSFLNEASVHGRARRGPCGYVCRHLGPVALPVPHAR